MIAGGSKKMVFVSLLLLVGVTSTSVFAQPTDARTEIASSKMIYVSVLQKDGKFVTDLKKDEILVQTKNENLQLGSFEQVDEPIAIGILLDISNSMQWSDKVSSDVVSGLRGFFRMSNDENEYSLIRFAKNYEETVVASKDIDLIERKFLEPMNMPLGVTRFFDALGKGYDVLSSSMLRKKALLIISDGEDWGSKLDINDAREWARERNVLLYFVWIKTSNDRASVTSMQSQAFMDELIELTGGRHFAGISPHDIPIVFRSIGEELRSQYAAEVLKGKTKDNSDPTKLTFKIIRKVPTKQEKFIVRTRKAVKF